MIPSTGPAAPVAAPLAPASGHAPDLLAVEGLTVHHGQLEALHGVSFEVAPGEVYAFIGANGAGKSTLLRTIAGLHRPTAGRIVFEKPRERMERFQPVFGVGLEPLTAGR